MGMSKALSTTRQLRDAHSFVNVPSESMTVSMPSFRACISAGCSCVSLNAECDWHNGFPQ